MQSSCGTKDEYNISKILLFHYVDSKFLKENIGDIAARTIILYFRTYLFVREDKFVFYKRIHVRHFDEYTNSCGEGTNNAIKNSSIASKPNITADKYLSILVLNGKRSVTKKLQPCSRQKVGSSSWYTLLCCKKLVHVGASLLTNQWTGAENYEYVKVSGTEFKVISLYKETSKPKNNLSEDMSRI